MFYTVKALDNHFVNLVRLTFELVPSFSFSMALGNVFLNAGTHIDMDDLSWKPPVGFGWDDYYKTSEKWVDEVKSNIRYLPSSYFVGKLVKL
jgi:hypothetical protein